MKYVICFLFVFNGLFAQNKDALISLTKTYQEQYCLKKSDKILFYTFPKVFDVVSYDLLKEQLEDHFDNDQMKVRYQNWESEIQLSEIYCNLNYHFIKATFDIKFTITYKDDIDDAKETIIEFINQVIKPKEITFDASSQTFTIIKPLKILAITEIQHPDHWRFIHLERDKFILNLLFDKETVEKINNL